MFGDWWTAHRAEFVMAGVLLAVALAFVVPHVAVDLWREWRRKKKDGLL